MEVIQSHRLRQIDGLRHGFFCPGVQGSSQDNLSFKNGDGPSVLDARRRACGLLQIPADHLTHVYQEHGTVIWNVFPYHRGKGAVDGTGQIGVGDAMITEADQLPLAILIADCLPIFYSTPQADVVGIAHAGWRGTYETIAGKMIECFRNDYGVPPSDLRVWIGPGISIQGFTVGDEVWELFKKKWGDHPDCFDEKKRAIDLKRVNQIQLETGGVLAENIEVSPECTFSDRRFFSYRRDGAGFGHNMAIIMKDAAETS